MDNLNLENTPSLTRTFYSIFRKLIKVALARGLQYPEAEILLKHAYIDTLRANAKLPGETRVPDSRILAKSGISRRDLQACNEQQEKLALGLEKWSFSNRLAQIVNAWQNEEGYIDEDGFPIVIAKRGRRPSLQDLVERHSGGLTPRAVLDELMINQIIEPYKKNKLRLVKTEFSLIGGDDINKTNRQNQELGEMVGNLIDSIAHNFSQSADSEKYYQAQINPRVLPEELATEFEVGVSNALHDVLTTWNKWCDEKVHEYQEYHASEKDGLSGSGSAPKAKVTVRNVGAGAYFIHKTLK